MELPVNIYPDRELKLIEQAVIDRFEGDWVVLILTNRQELLVKREQLPAAAQPGNWLYIERQQGQLVSVVYDETATAIAEERIRAKLERIRQGTHLE